MTSLNLKALSQFREQVYQLLRPSRDAVFEIIDAITQSPGARSAVEVSLAPGMQRKFSSVYKGLVRTRLNAPALRKLLVSTAEAHEHFQVAGYAVWAVDHSPYPRHAAPTVTDCGYVHGADGEEIGHQYSLLGRVMHPTGSWVGLTDIRRIATTTTPTQVAAEQVAELKKFSLVPIILTADSEYFIEALVKQLEPGRCEGLMRLKSNRVMYDKAPPHTGKPGRPLEHGAKLKLNQPASLRAADRTYRLEDTDQSWIALDLWFDVHERRWPTRAVCLIRAQQFNADGTPRFQRPLWLAWTGPTDMDWPTFWKVYLRRVCLESLHQFGKNSLVWTQTRLGYTEHEERWTWLVALAYWQLFLALPAAHDVRRPWEKPTAEGRPLSPGRVQRDISRILAELGTLASPPKPRGNPRGRAKGYRPAPRPRYPVICKSAKRC